LAQKPAFKTLLFAYPIPTLPFQAKAFKSEVFHFSVKLGCAWAAAASVADIP
jgi:hypothetical protein